MEHSADVTHAAALANKRRSVPFIPILGGALAAIALIGLYLGIISAAESFRHALDQLRTDAVWVALVSLGFGIQMGLFLQVRHLVRSGVPAATKTMTGAGTGASTAGMVACCAHHLADIAPFLGLTGATAFLTQYRLAFILAGLAVNLAGIWFSVRTMRKMQRHLQAMAAPSCH